MPVTRNCRLRARRLRQGFGKWGILLAATQPGGASRRTRKQQIAVCAREPVAGIRQFLKMGMRFRQRICGLVWRLASSQGTTLTQQGKTDARDQLRVPGVFPNSRICLRIERRWPRERWQSVVWQRTRSAMTKCPDDVSEKRRCIARVHRSKHAGGATTRVVATGKSNEMRAMRLRRALRNVPRLPLRKRRTPARHQYRDS